MKSQLVEYDRFDKGIDLRQSSSVSDANKLVVLNNAFVTDGWAIRKRAGLKKVSNLSSDSVGLIQSDGDLFTLSTSVEVSHSNPDIGNFRIPHPTVSTLKIVEVHYSETFNGQPYVIIQYDNGDIYHAYNSVIITDSANPRSKSAVKLASRMYAVSDDTVRMSAVNDPTTWTVVSGVTDGTGFLPTGLQAPASEKPLAVSEYDGLLAVFMVDSIQLWAVDPDPDQHSLIKIIRNIGTQFPKTIAQYSNDLMFLSDAGFRSISRQQFTDNREDNDIGSAIDEIVLPVIKNISEFENIKSVYYPNGGQYICLIGGKAFVFKYSRSARINAWSTYTFNSRIDDLVSLNGDIYFRIGDELFIFDEDTHTDNGDNFPVTIQTSFQAQKAVGVTKFYKGFDIAQKGTSNIAFLTNEGDDSVKTEAFEVSGNSRPYGINPIGAVAHSLAFEIKNENNQEFQLDSLILYFNRVGSHVW